MKTIFIDSEFKCHITNDGTMMPVETAFFDGKSNEYIEGYRFVPSGESWTRADGVVFAGEMIAPWKEYSILAAAQLEYERKQLAEMQAALADADAAQAAYEQGVQEA